MESIGHAIGGAFVPLMVLLVVIAIIAAIALVAKRYIRVGPNSCAVIFGRKKTIVERDAQGVEIKKKIGFRTVCGGATFIWPIVERVEYMDLTVMNIPVSTMGAITKYGVPLTVEAIANVKIGSDDVSLRNAAERLLGKSEAEIQEIVRKTLEAHLRSICGTLTIEEINSDRQAFSQKVTSEAAEDLKKLGIIIDMLPVQHLKDEVGYLEALGKQRTAEVQRDAQIGVALAQKEATIKSTDAHREGEIQRQDNLAKEAEANKKREVQVQQYTAEIEAATAKAEQAGPLANAEARQMVVIQQVKVEEEKTKAEISVEEQHILREQKAQEAVTVVPAKAKADASVREAEGYRDSEKAKAEGDKYATIARAEAEQKKLEAEGTGEASAIKAKGLAQAEVTKQTGLAEAEVIKQKGLAEAEALAKKAEAYAKFKEAAIWLELSKQAPGIVKALSEVMGAIAAPMGNIDKLTVVDSGGTGEGKGALSRFSQTAPLVLFNLVEQAKAAGFDLGALLKKIGVKTEGTTDSEATEENTTKKR